MDPDHLPSPVRALDEIEAELVTLAAHRSVATCRWLLLLAEFDRRDGWAGWNVLSCAHWLSWKVGVSRHVAREYLRVARSLECRPFIAASFAAGRISYSKVRAITRIADEAMEETLVAIAEHSTAAQTDRVVSGFARAEHLANEAPEHDEYVRWEYDDDGCVVVHARLAPERGARALLALDAAKAAVNMAECPDASPNSPDDVPAGTSLAPISRSEHAFPVPGAPVCVPAARDPRDCSSGRLGAEALSHLCDAALSGGLAVSAEEEKSLVVIHVDAETILRAESRADSLCELDSGWAISPQTARRLACDSQTVRLIVDANGSTIDAGRKTRIISRRLRRALAARDRCCRVPGCGRPVAEWHHIWHWIDGGPTNRANLVGLCVFHHVRVHAGDLTISTPGDQTFTFIHRGGLHMPEAPRPPAVAGTLEETQPWVDIDDDTLVPNWYGEDLDLDYVVGLLYECKGAAARPEAS